MEQRNNISNTKTIIWKQPRLTVNGKWLINGWCLCMVQVDILWSCRGTPQGQNVAKLDDYQSFYPHVISEILRPPFNKLQRTVLQAFTIKLNFELEIIIY